MEAGSQAKVLIPSELSQSGEPTYAVRHVSNELSGGDTIIFLPSSSRVFYKVFMGTPQDHVDEDAFAAALMAASASLVLLYVLSVGWSL